MADTTFATGDNLTRKIWGKAAFYDSVKATLFGKLMGKGDTSIVQVKTELNKEAGDRVRFRLRALPTGAGKTGDETLEGYEEGLVYYNFDLSIDTMRHAHKVSLLMNQQRVDWDLRSDAKDAQSEWWEERFDSYFIRSLSGDTTLPGVWAGTAPTTNRIIYGGDATAKNNVDSADKMSLTLIDRLVEKAKLASPTMRKAKFGGKSAFVLVLHPYQVYDLRTNTSAGQWLDIQKAAMQGGKVEDNPIFTEALGVYNGVILVESTRVMTFSDYGAGGNVNAARALFLGAQAACVSFGKGYDYDGFKWVERKWDFEAKYAVSATCLWGMKKTVFNSEDFGVIAVDTAATAH
jgi:N4-gp56 family major capsid protein